MLVTSLPNLEYLSLSARHFGPWNDPMSEMYHPPACLARLQVPSLPKLRDLHVYVHMYGKHFSLMDVGLNALLGAAPNLEKLHLEGISTVHEGLDLATIQRRVPTLDKLATLILEQCCMGADSENRVFNYLRELVRRCPELRCFEFRAGDEDSADFPITRLLAALEARRETLEEVSLRYKSCGVETRTLPTRHDFESLPNLKVLGLDRTAFCRHRKGITGGQYHATCLVDVVPVSVSKLCIDLSDDFEMAFKDVEFLAKRTNAGDYPNLQHVELERSVYTCLVSRQAHSPDDEFVSDHPLGDRFRDLVSALLAAKVTVSISEDFL